MEKKVANKKIAQMNQKINVITDKSGDTDKSTKCSVIYRMPFKRTGESGDHPQKNAQTNLGDTLKREYITERKKEEEKIKSEAPKRAIDELNATIRNVPNTVTTRKNSTSKTEALPPTENRNSDLKRRREIKFNFDTKSNATRKEIATNKSEVRYGTTKKKKTTDAPSANRAESTEAATTDQNKSNKELTSTTKKAMVRTLVSKKDTSKVYKAVTFVDQKNKPALKISIPNENANTKNVSTKATYANMPELPQDKSRKAAKPKKKRIARNASSPTFQCRNNSPQTEVAKWAPACLNQHTKPYYEAWVDTTLTAVSRNSKANKLLMEEFMRQTIQKSVEGEQSPEPVYENFVNLSRLGKIKVTQR